MDRKELIEEAARTLRAAGYAVVPIAATVNMVTAVRLDPMRVDGRPDEMVLLDEAAVTRIWGIMLSNAPRCISL